jgi:hypothetical protein
MQDHGGIRLIKRLVTVGLLLLTAIPNAHAIPPAAVGALASANVDWIGGVPDVAPTGARFRGDMMYMTTAAGLKIFKIGADGLPLPQGALALPHYENEDVDTNGSILLIAADHGFGFPNVLYVIDVSNPMVPLLLSTALVDSAHTASCIKNCTYAWLAGEEGIDVIDLRDPARPIEAGHFDMPARGQTHDVQVDAAGIAWVSAGGGLFGFSTADPVHPTRVASLADGTAGAFHNNFIIHNSLRPNAAAWKPRTSDDGTVHAGELLLVTEENWLNVDNDFCADDGRFQTGRYAVVNGVTKIAKLDDFHLGEGTVGGLETKAEAAICSSHYFSSPVGGVVGVSWYEQGTRFLDVSDPRNIRQIGYYMPVVGESFATYAYKGYFYVLDTNRGIEILKLTTGAGAPTELAPRLNTTHTTRLPHPTFGYACRLV